MFYGEESLSSFIKCKSCKTKLKEAKILPCDHFCSNCVDQLTKSTDKETREFTCKSCDETHTIPKKGFKAWKALNEFYSKELPLDTIYRGEKIEKLKKNLEKIRIQIEDLDLTLSKSVYSVKEHCLELRKEISSQAQMAIENIQNVRNEMIDKVCEYEKKCIYNLESNDKINHKFNEFLIELKCFNTEWTEYLKKCQINDAEIAKANNSVLKLKKRFKEEKTNLEKFIFRNKSMSFTKNDLKIETNFLGNLYDKTIGAIDINQFKIVKFKDILNNFNVFNNRYIDVCSFENQQLAVVYPDDSLRVNVAIIDKNQNISKTTRTNFYLNFINANFTSNSNYNTVQLKTIKSLIILFCKIKQLTPRTTPVLGTSIQYPSVQNLFYLSLVDSNLELIKSIDIQIPIVSIDANETSIYCLTNDNKIMIFDNQLNKAKTIDTISNNPRQPYTFGNISNVATVNHSTIQLLEKFNNFCHLYPGKIDILKGPDLIKSIPILGNKMAFDSQSNLLVLSVNSSKIYKYNLDGVLQNEIDLENVPAGLEFCVDEGDKILYFNKAQNCFYLDKF